MLLEWLFARGANMKYEKLSLKYLCYLFLYGVLLKILIFSTFDFLTNCCRFHDKKIWVTYLFCYKTVFFSLSTVQILCIGTDRSQQTVQTKIRLLLKKQSDQGLRCLPFHQHLLDALMQCYIKFFYFSIFRTVMAIV